MLLTAVIDHLKSHVPALKLVGTLSEIDTETVPAQVPAAFVLPIRDAATPARIAAGAHRQELTEICGVLLCVSRPSGPARAVLDLEDLKELVRQALIGWQPSGSSGGDGTTACDYVSGALVDAKPGGIVWWLLQFSTARQIIKR